MLKEYSDWKRTKHIINFNWTYNTAENEIRKLSWIVKIGWGFLVGLSRRSSGRVVANCSRVRKNFSQHDSVVDIAPATDGRSRVLSSVGARDFLFCVSVQTPSHLYSGYRGSLPVVKGTGRGGDQPSHLAPRLKKQYSCTCAPPLCLHGMLHGDFYLYIWAIN